MTFEDRGYSVCKVDTATDELRLFLTDPGGTPYGTFDAVDARLADLTQELRDAGWRVEYETEGTGGFPYRFDLDLRDLEHLELVGTEVLPHVA